jgi:hypothetical protein
MLVFMLSACASGFSLEKAVPDRSLVTGSIPASAPATPLPGNDDRLSDETTIRNAVSSVDLASLAGKPLAWANAETGARGEIDALAQKTRESGPCRTFRASRESFDGVRLFTGEACMAAGSWQMTRFDPV